MLPQYYGLHKKTLWYIHISHRVEPACFSRGFKSFLVLFPILLSVYTQYLSFFSAFYSGSKVSVILCPRCANMETAWNKYNQLMEREPFAAASLRSLVHNFSSPKSGENGTRLPPFTKNSSWLFGFGLSFPVDSA